MNNEPQNHEKRDLELQEIIKEQATEISLGSYQRPESFVAFSLNALPEGSAEKMGHDAIVRKFSGPSSRNYRVGCPTHGGAEMAQRQSNSQIVCKTCERERVAKYRASHLELVKERKRAYREKHRDQLKIKQKIYRENNRDKIRLAHREYERRVRAQHREG
jgi:hypothetical protein